QPEAQGLRAQVGGSIDQHHLTVHLELEARPPALVEGVVGGADGAGAADHRHAGGGAAAEHGDADRHRPGPFSRRATVSRTRLSSELITIHVGETAIRGTESGGSTRFGLVSATLHLTSFPRPVMKAARAEAAQGVICHAPQELPYISCISNSI